MINTGTKINEESVSYEVTEKGYVIYIGEKATFVQEEPHIPNPSLSYEENALEQIKMIYEATTPKLEDKKEQAIELSKRILEKYLLENPILLNIHSGVYKCYSITKEKQALLAQEITRAEIAKQTGFKYKPSWNAQGEPYTNDWTLSELQQLAFQIDWVVKPLISKQQIMETKIKSCTTIEEITDISLEF